MYIEANKTAESLLNKKDGRKTSGYVIRISLTAALAGFIFGFDTVVISGANLPIKELWHTSPWFHGFFIMSMALWGTVIGAIFGGPAYSKMGKEKSTGMDRRPFFPFCRGYGPCSGPLHVFFFQVYRWPGNRHFIGGRAYLYFRDLHRLQQGAAGGLISIQYRLRDPCCFFIQLFPPGHGRY